LSGIRYEAERENIVQGINLKSDLLTLKTSKEQEIKQKIRLERKVVKYRRNTEILCA
jgi:hypothetical protein